MRISGTYEAAEALCRQ